MVIRADAARPLRHATGDRWFVDGEVYQLGRGRPATVWSRRTLAAKP